MDLWLVYYLSIGIVIGFIAGLLGVGGGAIMIPALSWAFVQRGYGGEHVMHMSLGTCMATIILVSISSARAHHTHGAVNWTMVRRMTPGIVAGGLVGTWLARSIPTVTLAVMFAVFMCYVAFNMFTGWKPKGSRTTLGWAGTSGAGFLICFVCVLVGVGGAALTIPFLMWLAMPFHTAIGTAAALAIPIAISGAIGFVLSGVGQSGLPPNSIGYVYLPAFAAIAIGSALLTPLGARVAHRTPAKTLRRIMAVILCVLAIKQLWSLA